MDSVKKFNILSGSALIIALLSIYITTLHIDGLARQKYLYKRDVHSIRKKEISASDFSYSRLNRQKVHTKVVDATVDKIYTKKINSTVEYIFQYSYFLNESQALSVQIESARNIQKQANPWKKISFWECPRHKITTLSLMLV